jgi:hypothetical protein
MYDGVCNPCPIGGGITTRTSTESTPPGLVRSGASLVFFEKTGQCTEKDAADVAHWTSGETRQCA